jgi:competence protein ComEA
MGQWQSWQKSLLNILFGLLIGGLVLLIASQPRGAPIELDPIPTVAPITVHVAGSVQTPGVYELPQGSRVKDAVQAAGGLSTEANPTSINLAGLLRDGQQVFVDQKPAVSPTLNPSERQGLVNINTASSIELMTLPGIGETRAQDIIKYRQENNGFQNIEELLNVKGIGQTTFNNLKSLVTTGE